LSLMLSSRPSKSRGMADSLPRKPSASRIARSERLS
jgi:hypothetical protein